LPAVKHPCRFAILLCIALSACHHEDASHFVVMSGQVHVKIPSTNGSGCCVVVPRNTPVTYEAVNGVFDANISTPIATGTLRFVRQ
jgi:hypothetical protein